MTWTFHQDRCIRHQDGHLITLKSGDWLNPRYIKSSFDKPINPKDKINLINEGLAFARHHFRPLLNRQ